MIAQAAILILSALALWLLSSKPPSRWGWIVGLASQPFWIWETAHAEQWGMLANALVFTAIYARGAINAWFDHGLCAIVGHRMLLVATDLGIAGPSVCRRCGHIEPGIQWPRPPNPPQRFP